MYNIWICISLLFVQGIAYSQVDHWESVVLEGDDCRYLLPSNQPSPQWNENGFDDNSWSLDKSGFGYGDDDDNTLIQTPSTTIYIRKSFPIVDMEAIEDLIFYIDYDDGFVAYLNGIEIARNLVSGTPPAFDQFADSDHEALLYQGLIPDKFDLNTNMLVQGENILAVEVHNVNSSSSDMTAIPFLLSGINDESQNYNPTPSWFVAPVFVDFSSTMLPLIIINTENEELISDEPKIGASMKIINREDGGLYRIEDGSNPLYLDFDSRIEIEFRGSSSQLLPKKSYGFTTYDSDGLEKDNVKLLGMPKENDWILNSLAFDPSLIRDYLCYNLAREIGEYATRTRYCEVFINDEYKGLYLLQEKLKADQNRVDINKIEPEDNALPDLSGGYITKSDKTTGGDPIAWTMPNYGGWLTDFIHEVPKPEKVTFQQSDYIQIVFEDLAVAASNNNFSLDVGYPSIIDIPSFVDFFIINELASNPDAYQFSTYFHKDRNGKLRAGPVWDLNLSYGNDLFELNFDRSHTNIWQFEVGNTGAMFWKDLYDSDQFRCYLSRRWNELTQEGQPLHLDELTNRIDEAVTHIKGSIEREEAAWQRVGDHAAEIAAMKSWIAERMTWMNAQLGSFAACSNPSLPALVISKIHYHPTSEEYDDKDLEFIEITNTGNSLIDLTGAYFGGTGLVYQFPKNTTLGSGKSVLLSSDETTFKLAYEGAPNGEFSRSLSNSEQRISLLDGFGNLIDYVSYKDETPWPQEADGDGYFLELVDLNTDNSQGQNWKATPTSEFVVPEESIVASIRPTIQINVYPNPGIQYIQIKSASLIRKIKIIDSDGKLLNIQISDRTEWVYDAAHLSAGLYFLLIETDQGHEQRKFVIKN